MSNQKNEKPSRRLKPQLVLLVSLLGVFVIVAVGVHATAFRFYAEGNMGGGNGAINPAVVELKAELRKLQEERRLLEDKISLKNVQNCSASTPSKNIATWTDEEEYDVPGTKTELNRKLIKNKWRLERAGTCDPATHSNPIRGAAYLTHDICQLGHIPKDATHLFAYLADGGPLDVVIYGSDCMLDDIDNTAPYARTWHAATKHWFGAVFKAWAGKGKFRIHTLDPSGNNEVCVEKLVTRNEKWRWFPGHRVAWAFRRVVHEYFELEIPQKIFGKQSLQVSILKRLEDRNFNEDLTATFLREKFGKVADFRVVIFDNKSVSGRSLSSEVALTYKEQLQLLASSDIFIAAHGAALTNVVAMRRGSCVVELFPNNFRYYMFEELSRLLGIHYYSHEAVSPPKSCKDCPGRSGTPSLTEPVAFHGIKSCKKCNIIISEQDWYFLFKDAASAVWLSMSRRTDIHKFDVRKRK